MIDQEFEEDPQVEAAKFLLSSQEDRSVDPETQARLEALLKAAGMYIRIWFHYSFAHPNKFNSIKKKMHS